MAISHKITLCDFPALPGNNPKYYIFKPDVIRPANEHVNPAKKATARLASIAANDGAT